MAIHKRRVNGSRDPQNRNNDERHPGLPRTHYDWLDGTTPTLDGSSSSRGGSIGGATRNPYGVDLDIPIGSDNPIGEPYGKTNQAEFDPNNPWDWIRASYGADKGDAAAWLANAFNAAQVLQQMQFQNEQSNVAWNRQLYSEDRAYERTKFETLFNQYLAAGMSPIAALQAAAQGSPDVSGSSPAVGAGGAAAGNVNPDPFGSSKLALGALQGLGSFGSSVLSAVQRFAQLRESQRQFDLSLAEQKRQFDIPNFDLVNAYKGSDAFYSEVAPLFFKRALDTSLPFDHIKDTDLSPNDVLTSLHGDDGMRFLDLTAAIERHQGDPYFDAAFRHFMLSQNGVVARSIDMRNAQLQNDFLDARLVGQNVANSLSLLSYSDYQSFRYGMLRSAIENDSIFRERHGIYLGDDGEYYISQVDMLDGSTQTDVALSDYITWMSEGHLIRDFEFQGMSYLDIIQHAAEFQSLTLQSDLDLFHHNLNTMRHNAASDEFYSALDYIVSHATFNSLKDSKTFDTLTAWKAYLDRTGIGNAAKWSAEQGIKLYGIRKGNLPNANMGYEEHMSTDGKGNVSKYRVYR